MNILESRNFTTALLAFTIACTGIAHADTSSTDTTEPATIGTDKLESRDELYDGYLLSTPQIQNPLQPLANTTAAIEEMEIHSAVVTVADPLETHLARMFDIQLASLIRAYHARSYVLDGFAFTWDPKRGSGLDKGKRLPEEGTRGFRTEHRDMPGVLVFRKDLWRAGDYLATQNVPGVRYVVIFLVGESPTFGVQPEAFQQAAKCAAALNDTHLTGHKPLKTDCTELMGLHHPEEENLDLDVIGPTFSGSMQSLALALGGLERNALALSISVNVTSPSATVTSNIKMENWAEKLAAQKGNEVSINYCSLATTLEEQLRELCRIKAIEGEKENIVILTEESTFGRGVYDILNDWSSTKEDFDEEKPGLECPRDEKNKVINKDCGCSERIWVTQFPQNISAVRAEHSRQDQNTSDVLKDLTQSQGQLLELNLSTVDEAADRPPPYDRLLSSRSDELMLYGTFDALKVYVKPAAVAIVATDIRDRLFLLNEIRKNLTMSLPVLLEMDFLTAHPDYRKISRGSVVIPSGDTLVRLDAKEGHIVDKRHPAQETSFYSFPSDYSANIFKAALGFIDHFEEKPKENTHTESETDICSHLLEKPGEFGPMVTTLAGFQGLTKPRSKMLAADSRLSLELLVYMLFLAIGLLFSLVAFWLLVKRQKNTIMLWPFSRLNPKRFLTEEDEQADKPVEDFAPPKKIKWISLGMMAVSVSLFSIAATQLFLIQSRESYELLWNLPHGRDVWALICIFLIYVVVAIVGFWRLYLWRKRYNSYLGTGCEHDLYLYDDKCKGGQGASKFEPFFWVFISLTPATLVVLKILRVPTSVDEMWVPMLVSFLVLPVGAWFLVQFWKQWRNWSHFAMVLAQTMDVVSDKLTGEGKHFSRSEGWPNLLAIGDRPQSPFNLMVRSEDLDILRESPNNAKWSKDTRNLINRGEWPFGEGKTRAFERWQAQVVAEMRFAAVAVRTCAWCAILAPTFVLMGMDVYPAPWERLQTIISISLIVATFMAIMFVVLRLERHPLLSRMFTLHGTNLSLGGAFGALWPKLIAAVVILIPVLFPDVMEWLYTLLRSINSLN